MATTSEAGMVAMEAAANGGGSGGGSMSADGSMTQMPDDGSAGGTPTDAADGAADAGSAVDGSANIACTTATVAVDCPPKPCPLALTGCVGGFCQYQTIATCQARSFTGSFSSGAVDKQVGTTLLIGNIGELSAGYGPICKTTTCLTGGITP
jgi:hypothetical protein